MFEIGNSLREARERQQLDIVEAEQATKIRTKYLRLLEDEQFDQLPTGTYVKGFLRTYSEYLGLDGQLYVDEYNSRYASGEDVLEQRVRSTRPRQQRRDRRRIETRIVGLALVGITVVTALVIVAWRFGGSNSAEQLPLTPTPRPRPAPGGLYVQALRGNSWLVVRRGSESGRLLYQGTLERGQSQRFTTGRLWLNIGTPDNVAMRLNGRSVAVGGERPRSLIVTADAIVPAGPGT